MINTNNSLQNFQNSIREWYALKSQEFISTNYYLLEQEALRQLNFEKLIDKLDRKITFSSKKNIDYSCYNNLKTFYVSTNSNFHQQHFIPNKSEDYLTQHLNGFSRFEPTPELNIKDIFCNFNVVESSVLDNDKTKQNNIVVSDLCISNNCFDRNTLNLKCETFNSKKFFENKNLQNNKLVTKNDKNFNLNDVINVEEYKLKERLKTWIDFFTSYYNTLFQNVKCFEKNNTQKEFRIKLKSAIIDKINFSAKKKASNLDLAIVLNFFFDLFALKSIQDNNGVELLLENNEVILDFSMHLVAARYIELLKWDEDLMNIIVLIIVSICVKFKKFYKVFCATILHFSTLLKLNILNVFEKILSFSVAPPETSSLWIHTERCMFRLFYHVQFALKSSKEEKIENLQGPNLIQIFFEDVLNMKKPIICASTFFLTELLENFLTPLLKNAEKSNENILLLSQKWKKLAYCVLNFKWQEELDLILSLLPTENLKNILRVRHDAILCMFKHTLKVLEI